MKGVDFINIIKFSFINHPAGGWFKSGKVDKNKRRAGKRKFAPVSPDSFHLRAGSKNKTRWNPAP